MTFNFHNKKRERRHLLDAFLMIIGTLFMTAALIYVHDGFSLDALNFITCGTTLLLTPIIYSFLEFRIYKGGFDNSDEYFLLELLFDRITKRETEGITKGAKIKFWVFVAELTIGLTLLLVGLISYNTTAS